MQATQRANSHLPASAFLRKERMVANENGYFYRTREDQLVGPFATESAAKFDLNIFFHIIEIEQELSTSNLGKAG